MSLSESKEINVSIVDELLQKPELKAAVLNATRRYQSLIEKYNLYEADRELIWGVDSLNGQYSHIVLLVHERDKYGNRSAQQLITPKHLIDPIARNAAISDAYMDIIGARWKQVNERIITELRELEATEVSYANGR